MSGSRDTGQAMSEDAVELVQRLYDHWAQGDLRGQKAFDADITFSRIGPSGTGLDGEFHGIDQLAHALTEWHQSWVDVRIRAERIIALEDDRVLVLSHHTGSGRASGAPLDRRMADIWTARDGRLIRWESYWSRTEALCAAGLSE